MQFSPNRGRPTRKEVGVVDITKAYREALDKTQAERAYMVISDLTGSTDATFADARVGAALQHAHQALCSEVAKESLDSQKFKAMGDGVMIEVSQAVKACRIALSLVDEATYIRNEAGKSLPSEFRDFRLKVIVAVGEFRRSPGTQRWLGFLPTKASRIAAFARTNEVWVDNEVALEIRPYLIHLDASCDYIYENGAAFFVPLKGLSDARISIHLLNRKDTPRNVTKDELKKTWQIPWGSVMSWLGDIATQIRHSSFNPTRVVGLGRSGAILGGILAGNLGHLPVDVLERRLEGRKRILSTITEPQETYNGDSCEVAIREPMATWDRQARVLLVIGEDKTGLSLAAGRAWLARRGVTEIRTVALVRSQSAEADWYWLESGNAWMPWQFVSGYDLLWPTYANSGGISEPASP